MRATCVCACTCSRVVFMSCLFVRGTRARSQTHPPRRLQAVSRLTGWCHCPRNWTCGNGSGSSSSCCHRRSSPPSKWAPNALLPRAPSPHEHPHRTYAHTRTRTRTRNSPLRPLRQWEAGSCCLRYLCCRCLCYLQLAPSVSPRVSLLPRVNFHCVSSLCCVSPHRYWPGNARHRVWLHGLHQIDLPRYPPGPQINILAWVFCMRWCANFEFGGGQCCRWR